MECSTNEKEKLVLPDRIELSTSPLPMECSTTELRQHAPDDENPAEKASRQRADPCHRGGAGASAGRVRIARKSCMNSRRRTRLQPHQFRADPVPHLLAQ